MDAEVPEAPGAVLAKQTDWFGDEEGVGAESLLAAGSDLAEVAIPERREVRKGGRGGRGRSRVRDLEVRLAFGCCVGNPAMQPLSQRYVRLFSYWLPRRQLCAAVADPSRRIVL